MSNVNKKYNNVTIASGWLKSSKTGQQYISAAANGKGSKTKLQAVLEDGSVVPVNNFFVFFATDKDNENSPDARFVFSQE